MLHPDVEDGVIFREAGTKHGIDTIFNHFMFFVSTLTSLIIKLNNQNIRLKKHMSQTSSVELTLRTKKQFLKYLVIKYGIMCTHF